MAKKIKENLKNTKNVEVQNLYVGQRMSTYFTYFRHFNLFTTG